MEQRMLPQQLRYGVKSQKFLQPSEDFIERNKAHFPNWNGVVGQIENAIAGCRAKTREAYVAKYFNDKRLHSQQGSRLR
ncbi:hypothetical protein Barb4_04381 [Bacteroidales bacterium Barb4]|nr:hypothetical protein Barb4_04381 [Bacteroidales bacterium Barb4]